MALAILAAVVGLVVLVWAADKFVDGVAAAARHFGMPSLLVGIVIVGFGTSAPEMVVSALSAAQGASGLALGNAYGSNIANIGLILGVTALISPVMVQARALKVELPLLALATALAAWQIWDGRISRADALTMLAVFAAMMGLTIWRGMRSKEAEAAEGADGPIMPLGRAVFWIVAGLVFLILSSRALVWGAVEIARDLGVSDLIIGLTIVAVGTSLPELASSIAAAKKGEDDIAFGNIIGSNLFNTLMVVGLAGAISPLEVESAAISRDLPVMAALTLSLFVFGYAFKKEGRRAQGRINRIEGGILLAVYAAYTAGLVLSAAASQA